MASTMAAGELIVIDVDTRPRSMPANRASMSARVSMATPHRPTSPSASGSSESRPMSVGRSKAIDRPWPPAANNARMRPLDSSADPKPANIRCVHSFVRYMEA